MTSFLANVGLAFCFCVGVYSVGRAGHSLIERLVDALCDAVIRPPPKLPHEEDRDDRNLR